jgi:hypothetical protein
MVRQQLADVPDFSVFFDALGLGLNDLDGFVLLFNKDAHLVWLRLAARKNEY